MGKSFSCLLLFLFVHSLAFGQNDTQRVLDNVDRLILNSQFNEALSLLQQSKGESPSLLLQNKKAEVLIRMGKFGEARDLMEAVTTQATVQSDTYVLAITGTNLGFLQLNQGRSDLAEASLQKALLQFESAQTTSGVELAQALAHLGIVYITEGKYSQAQDQLHRALSLREELPANKDAFIAATYNDLGLAYSQTDKDLALDYYERALGMYRTIYGDQDPKIAIANINIGIIYRELDLLGDAVNNFETALKIWNAVYPQPHPAKAIALYNLGQTYLQMNDQKAADSFYQKALKMYEDCYGLQHPETASVLNAVGNLRLAQSNFPAALTAYQDALKANVQGFTADDPRVNPPLDHYYNGMRLLHTLLFKAQAFAARYTGKSLKFSDLTLALQTLSLCDSLIDQLRQHSTNESDKLQLGVMANEVYADGVRVAYLAGLNALRKDPYFEKAFYFAEKSKGAVLLESISDANAKSFAGIPPDLLEEERDIKSAIALTAQKLAEKPPAEEERLLRENSYELKRKYDGFIRKLERDYPEYFNLKFNTSTPSTGQVRQLLDDKTALISYFVDDKHHHLYTFILRRQQYRVLQRSLSKDFDKYITGLRNGIYFQEPYTYKTSAYELGRLLLPALPSSVSELVILPAGRLGLIPFETLLTDDVASTSYTTLPYVINRYALRYEFSAGLLLQKSRHHPATSQPSIFLCAPVSFPDRQYLGELPGTEKEVQEISRLFSERHLTSASYTRLQADEKLIKTSSLGDYAYIHFATHGVVDESNPELSRIFLQSGPQDDGNLFAGEIYNLKLNASLVTLSACQTGLGKVLKGEGVIGLSRALVYAGARNIVVSYWNVADESTAILMKAFYRDLLQTPGADYSQSLRQAKLQLARDDKFSAPFYWAPFVLIGF